MRGETKGLGTIARAMVMALLMAGVLGFSGVSAQDATPEAVGCYSPGLPPGTPTPEEEMVEEEAAASPEAMEGMEMASPEASPAAVEPLVAPVLPEGQPADEETALAVTASIENYAACSQDAITTGDPSLYVALQTPNYWESQGFTNPYDLIRAESEEPLESIELQSIDNPRSYDDGRVSGDLQIVANGNWVVKLRFFLAQDGLLWKLDEEASLRPEPVAESVSVNGIQIVETPDEATGQKKYEFVSTVGSFDWAPAEALVINVSNTGEELHETIVLQLPEGADPAGLLDGSLSFDDVTFYGGVFDIYPGTSQDIVLLNLEPGAYTLICFFPAPDGTPHAALGMIGTFNIVAPEA
jgi:hypothetical protein